MSSSAVERLVVISSSGSTCLHHRRLRDTHYIYIYIQTSGSVNGTADASVAPSRKRALCHCTANINNSKSKTKIAARVFGTKQKI